MPKWKESWKMVKCLFQRKLLHVSVPMKGWICHTTSKGWFLPGKAIDLCSHMLYLNWNCPKRDGPTFQILWTNFSKLLRVIFPHVTGHMPPFQALSRSNLMGFSSHPVFSIALLVGQNCMCLAVWGCFPLPTKKSCLQRSSYDSNKNKNQDSCHFFCQEIPKTLHFPLLVGRDCPREFHGIHQTKICVRFYCRGIVDHPFCPPNSCDVKNSCLAPCFTICHSVVWFSFVITWSVDLLDSLCKYQAW